MTQPRTIRSCLLLINPNSRSGRSNMERAKSEFRHYRIDVDAPGIDDPDDSRRAIARTDADCIVIGGGDGTISSVGQALLDAGKPVGLLPLGTANDLARTLGLPMQLDQAIEVIAHGRLKRFDLGLANGRPFFNAVIIGFGVDVRDAHESDQMKKLGVFNYPRVVLLNMRQRRYFKAAVTIDDKPGKTMRLLHVGVANGRYHGGGLPAHEEASLDDQLLHFYGIRAASPLRYLRLLPSLLRGTDDNPDILRLEGRIITIETDEPRTVTADGEEIGQTPVEIECLPEAIEMFVP